MFAFLFDSRMVEPACALEHINILLLGKMSFYLVLIIKISLQYHTSHLCVFQVEVLCSCLVVVGMLWARETQMREVVETLVRGPNLIFVLMTQVSRLTYAYID